MSGGQILNGSIIAELNGIFSAKWQIDSEAKRPTHTKSRIQCAIIQEIYIYFTICFNTGPQRTRFSY